MRVRLPPTTFTSLNRPSTLRLTRHLSTPSSTMSSQSPAPPAFDLKTTSIPELSPFIQPPSTKSLATLLSDNHASHHCFFNTRGMHNHSVHQLIADLTLGSDPSQLSQHYDYQKKHYLGEFSLNDRKKFDPHVQGAETKIEKITQDNWKTHLGNARYYWSYLHFFNAAIKQDGYKECLEKCIFSPAANEAGKDMVVRFYGGVLHALIHFGYGLELNTAGTAAEGLAMATSTAASHAWLFPYDWLTSVPERTDKAGLMELLKEIQEDDRLSKEALKLDDNDSGLPDEPFENPSSAAQGLIHEYVDRWAAITPTQVDRKQAEAELALFSALLLGAVPKTGEGWYRHDFFLMHLNNAHLFTSLYLDLAPSLAPTFLRGLLAQFLFYYISRGRPLFSSSVLFSESAERELGWEKMFKLSRENVDEHLPKAVRALYVYDSRHKQAQEKLGSSGVLQGWKEGEASVWELTARQLVRMHQGEVQPSKYGGEGAKRKGESIGSHQEFWSFDRF